MSFLTESDDGKYKGERKTMLNQKKVVSIEEIVTPEGRLTLDQALVDKVRRELLPKMTKAATQQEKAYIYLH